MPHGQKKHISSKLTIATCGVSVAGTGEERQTDVGDLPILVKLKTFSCTALHCDCVVDSLGILAERSSRLKEMGISRWVPMEWNSDTV